jgi:hypothetical protein
MKYISISIIYFFYFTTFAQQSSISGELIIGINSIDLSQYRVVLEGSNSNQNIPLVKEESNGITRYTYSFLVPDGDYSLYMTCSDSTSSLDGVSTLDYVLILSHILGQKIFTKKVDTYSADVNNNGKISASDLVEIRKLILGITTSFKPSWICLPQSLINTPFSSNIDPRFLDVTVQGQNISGQNFIRQKIGDINGNSGG